MKKILGLVQIALAVSIILLFSYEILTSEQELSWFSLIIPLPFIGLGLLNLRTTPSLEASENVKFDRTAGDTSSVFDSLKRTTLVEKLKNMRGETIISINEFLDGNFNDEGAIGCNIYPSHPGIDCFRKVLLGLLERDDVEQIYAHISEIEPDSESWPYSDRLYIFGKIEIETLVKATEVIEPTDITDSKGFFSAVPREVTSMSELPLKVMWWD